MTEETVKVEGEWSGKFFSFSIPSHYIGFLNYLSVSGLKAECFADDSAIELNKKLIPPYLVKREIACFGENKEREEKTVKVLLDLETYFDIFDTTPIAARDNGEAAVEARELKKLVKTQEKNPTYSHIVNHHLNEAGRWYEIKLEHDIVTWQLKARGNFELYYCFEPSHSNYMTLVAGDVLSEDTIPNREIDAIYVMSETEGLVVEMEIWRHGEKHV